MVPQALINLEASDHACEAQISYLFYLVKQISYLNVLFAAFFNKQSPITTVGCILRAVEPNKSHEQGKTALAHPPALHGITAGLELGSDLVHMVN